MFRLTEFGWEGHQIVVSGLKLSIFPTFLKGKKLQLQVLLMVHKLKNLDFLNLKTKNPNL